MKRGGFAARENVDRIVLAGQPVVDQGIALTGGDGAEGHPVAGHRPGRHVPVPGVGHHDDGPFPFVENGAQAVGIHGHVLDVPRDPVLCEPRRADHFDRVLKKVRQRKAGDGPGFARRFLRERFADAGQRPGAFEGENVRHQPGETARAGAGRAVGDGVDEDTRRAQNAVFEPAGGF